MDSFGCCIEDTGSFLSDTLLCRRSLEVFGLGRFSGVGFVTEVGWARVTGVLLSAREGVDGLMVGVLSGHKEAYRCFTSLWTFSRVFRPGFV
jgi:hypothetical protein